MRFPTAIDRIGLALIAFSFAWTHWRSHVEHVAADLQGRPNIGKLMFMPYVRIFPMHFIIIFGAISGGGRGTLLLFVVMKTLADLAMHRIEHRQLQVALEKPVKPEQTAVRRNNE